MPPVPCLAYLLDTPTQPGVVVTHRCTLPAGHGTRGHTDADSGAHWDSGPGDVLAVPDGRTATVTWAATAVYPAADGTAEDAPRRIPPRTDTTGTNGTTPHGSTPPWAQAASDARAQGTTPTPRSTS